MAVFTSSRSDIMISLLASQHPREGWGPSGPRPALWQPSCTATLDTGHPNHMEDPGEVPVSNGRWEGGHPLLLPVKAIQLLMSR